MNSPLWNWCFLEYEKSKSLESLPAFQTKLRPCDIKHLYSWIFKPICSCIGFVQCLWVFPSRTPYVNLSEWLMGMQGLRNPEICIYLSKGYSQCVNISFPCCASILCQNINVKQALEFFSCSWTLWSTHKDI